MINFKGFLFYFKNTFLFLFLFFYFSYALSLATEEIVRTVIADKDGTKIVIHFTFSQTPGDQPIADLEKSDQLAPISSDIVLRAVDFEKIADAMADQYKNFCDRQNCSLRGDDIYINVKIKLNSIFFPNLSEPAGSGNTFLTFFGKGKTSFLNNTFTMFFIANDFQYVLDNIAPHEISHVLLGRMFQTPLPRCFDEGTCTLEESESFVNRTCLQFFERKKIIFGPTGLCRSFDSFFKIEAYSQDKQEVYDLYNSGALIAGYFIDKYGYDIYYKFISLVIRGKTLQTGIIDKIPEIKEVLNPTGKANFNYDVAMRNDFFSYLNSLGKDPKQACKVFAQRIKSKDKKNQLVTTFSREECKNFVILYKNISQKLPDNIKVACKDYLSEVE
ncbi:MAG: hypothetical protein FJY91_01815 [Candidatus Harrisonbacteria bacterium]|nr:hypothetical protein [Candidatus Harrisonbacteria bacterium]